MNRLVLNNGGVVDEHVDSTVRVEEFGNDSLPELGIGHVTLIEALAVQKACGGALVINHSDQGALFHEAVGDTTANALCGTGDNGDFAFESHR
jgi:hypothetical protein